MLVLSLVLCQFLRVFAKILQLFHIVDVNTGLLFEQFLEIQLLQSYLIPQFVDFDLRILWERDCLRPLLLEEVKRLLFGQNLGLGHLGDAPVLV